MQNDVKKHITIRVNDDKEVLTIGNYIHKQLMGKPDYIENRVILNIDSPNEVNVYIFEDCEEDITLNI